MRNSCDSEYNALHRLRINIHVTVGPQFPERPLHTGPGQWISAVSGDGRVAPEGSGWDSSFLRDPRGSARSGCSVDES